MAHDVFTFVAVKRITAEHPIGSGIDVTYEPGDEVPAGEWGRSADNLIEVGKIMRVAKLVPDENDSPAGARVGDTSPPPTVERTADEVNAETANEPPPASSADSPDGGWPRYHGKGKYELSDGSFVYGKNKASVAQEALGAAPNESEGGDAA